MKQKEELTSEEMDIVRRGVDALTRELGPLGMMQFFSINGLGRGDYTRDRYKWLDKGPARKIKAKASAKKS